MAEVTMAENQNDVVESKMEDPNMEEIDDEDDADLEVLTFSRPFPKHIRTSLQKDWPIVESALQEYHISCSLNSDKCSMTFCTTKPTDGDIIDRARSFERVANSSFKPIKILNGSHWAIIKFGYQKDGVRSKFGISKEQFLEQRNQLSHSSLKEFGDIIWCDIFSGDDTVVAVGSLRGVKIVQKIVEECIVCKVSIASRIKTAIAAKSEWKTCKKFEALRF